MREDCSVNGRKRKSRRSEGTALAESVAGLWLVISFSIVVISVMSFLSMYLYASQMLAFAAQKAAQYAAFQISVQGPSYASGQMSSDVNTIANKVFTLNNVLAGATATATVDDASSPTCVTVTTALNGVHIMSGFVLGAGLPNSLTVTQSATAVVAPPAFPLSAEILFPGNDRGWVNFGHNGGAVLVPCYGYSLSTPYAAAPGSGSPPKKQPLIAVDGTQWMFQPDSGFWEHATQTTGPYSP
jgi:hypothetical protein